MVNHQKDKEERSVQISDRDLCEYIWNYRPLQSAIRKAKWTKKLLKREGLR